MYKTLTIGTDEVEYLKRIFRAAAQFYQIISLRELFGIIVLKYGRHIPEEQFIAFSEIVQSDSDRGFFNIFSDDELFSDEGKSAPMDRLVVHEALTDIDPDNFYEMYDVKSYCPLRLKILPEQELLKYEEDGYLEDTRECSTLRRFFIKNAGLSNCESDDVMGFLAFYSKQPDLRNVMLDALDSLERMGVELSKKQYHEFLRLWIPFHNKLRMPALNGHDPTEARELGYRFLNSYIPPDIDLPEIVTEPEGYFVGQTGFVPEQAPLPVRVQKPGRNDPCPCGSGKKYKKCCGR